jgi:2',3'-cyclic-nucleotide 2'-phosphodiesterase (5'-nucleotidase family)
MRRFRHRFATAILALALLVPSLAQPGVLAQDATPVAEDASAPLLLFAAPGLRADLVETFAAEGALPALAAMLEDGARAEGGLVAPIPATTGPGLTTLLTGTWPAEHGIVGDRFFRTGSPTFSDWTGWDNAGIVQAETLPQAVERAGKQVVAVGWGGVTALDPPLSGPVVGKPIPLSQSGVLVNYAPPDQPARAEGAGVAHERVELEPAEDWVGAPESFSPAQETAFTIASLDPTGSNPDRSFDVLIYDSSDDAATNYDRVLVAPEKDGATAFADLEAGVWGSATVELVGDQAGQTAGFWFAPLDLAPDLSQFRLYATPIGSFAASWSGCVAVPACEEPGGFAEALNREIGAPIAIDPSALEAGLLDEAAFVELTTAAAAQQAGILRFILDDLAIEPDLLLLGATAPEAVSRLLLGFALAADAGGLQAQTEDTTRQAERLDLLRKSYQAADQLLAVGQNLLGSDATTLVASPTALVPSALAVNAGQVLVDAGVAEAAQPENCAPGSVETPPGTPDPEALPVGPAVKACWSGGTAQIYVNLDGREAAGSVAEDDYEAVRDAVVAAFEGLAHEADPDADVVAAVFRKEELRDIGGADALHPSRSGDVVVVLAPPYRFDDAVEGEAIGKATTRAAGGYLPSEEGGLFLAGGPAIANGVSAPVRAIDVAPTAAFLLDVPGPYNASGRILYEVLADGPSLREVTLLDISDFHGQLPPLSAAADDIEVEGAVNDSYGVGGVAFLDPWFDRYRAEARGETILVTAGDAVGATPPISQVFGDLPTIEAMNALGFTADGLGNHNFDAGADYMFGTLDPAAEFPYLSVNLVPSGADAPAETPFFASMLMEIEGVSVGLIGFSNPDIPQLTRPGALDPYRVVDPAPEINAEAAYLRGEGADVIIALGHMGATGGTLTEPTGPVVEVANQLTGVDVVVGDHTDVQVSALLPNDVLLVENRSKGVMFTRVRMVVDAESGEVVYRTADHHRPWTIGITPDPEIAAALEALEVELAPILGVVIGEATQPILRSDHCGMETGRTCESLIGNVVADAMRLTYGADFAITNSGGIRADLTCPVEGSDLCPADGGGTAITEGQVLTVLPFGNVVVTLEVSGAELKEMLEVGVGRMPEASGAFPQVSGLCFTYDITAEPGDRVTGAVRQAEDGSCTGEAIDLTDAATYTIVTNDFTASGGDGYPDLLARADTRNILAEVVSAYVAGESPLALPGEPLDPQIEGRIVCEGEGCPTPAGG